MCSLFFFLSVQVFLDYQFINVFFFAHTKYTHTRVHKRMCVGSAPPVMFLSSLEWRSAGDHWELISVCLIPSTQQTS